jgi:hypothetical protein
MGLQKDYTLVEWDAREDYYTQALIALNIPGQPGSKDVMDLTSKLDALYTEASFDFAYIKRKQELVETDLKNAEAELFSTIKQQQLNANAKITENDVKGLVKTYIATNQIKGYNSDLYTLGKYYIRRSIFIERVIKIISEKKQALIVTTAMLKLENSFSDAKDLNKQSGPAGSYAYNDV